MSETMKVGRAGWPPGPWDEEPDRVEFESHGFPCLIVRQGGLDPRGTSGHLCGYVGVPPGHPMHGKSFSDGGYDEAGENYVSPATSDLSVHGGITYARSCEGDVCHVPKPGEPEDVWWLGFDCHHSWDLSPAYVARGYSSLGEGIYRTVAYVRGECERLAAQLAGAA